MRQRWLGVAVLVLVGAGTVLSASVAFAAAVVDWPFAGANRANTRYQVDEKAISVKNAASLGQKWVFTTAGDVTATPAVQDGTVYVPDSGGSLYAIDRSRPYEVVFERRRGVGDPESLEHNAGCFRKGARSRHPAGTGDRV